jgi:hypothetical protein
MNACWFWNFENLGCYNYAQPRSARLHLVARQAWWIQTSTWLNACFSTILWSKQLKAYLGHVWEERLNRLVSKAKYVRGQTVATLWMVTQGTTSNYPLPPQYRWECHGPYSLTCSHPSHIQSTAIPTSPTMTPHQALTPIDPQLSMSFSRLLCKRHEFLTTVTQINSATMPRLICPSTIATRPTTTTKEREAFDLIGIGTFDPPSQWSGYLSIPPCFYKYANATCKF